MDMDGLMFFSLKTSIRGKLQVITANLGQGLCCLEGEYIPSFHVDPGIQEISSPTKKP